VESRRQKSRRSHTESHNVTKGILAASPPRGARAHAQKTASQNRCLYAQGQSNVWEPGRGPVSVQYEVVEPILTSPDSGPARRGTDLRAAVHSDDKRVLARRCCENLLSIETPVRTTIRRQGEDGCGSDWRSLGGRVGQALRLASSVAALLHAHQARVATGHQLASLHRAAAILLQAIQHWSSHCWTCHGVEHLLLIEAPMRAAICGKGEDGRCSDWRCLGGRIGQTLRLASAVAACLHARQPTVARGRQLANCQSDTAILLQALQHLSCHRPARREEQAHAAKSAGGSHFMPG